MKKLISSILLTCFLFLGAGFVNSAQATTKAPKIVVGADLKEYKKLRKKQCDIIVPKQYPTIQAGVDAAVAGNTVCVRRGIYNEDVSITKSIRLAGNGIKKPSTINGQNGTVMIYANNVIVEGFVIHGVGLNTTNAAVLIGEASSNITLRNNYIVAGNGARAIRADAAQNNDLIQNNIIKGDDSPLLVSVSGTPLDPSKPSNKVDFISNTFIGTVNQTAVADTGVVLTEHATNSLIERNVFDTTGLSTLLIAYAYGSGTGGVNYNNFNSVATIKVNVSVGTLNAENNWWGDLDPSDNILHDVDYTPFATSPFKQN